MSSDNDGSRHYSDDEVEQILDRATELETHRPSASRKGGGMSLTELQEIGVEAGIDPSLLRQAAHELDVGVQREPSDAMAKWLGAPLHLSLERVIPAEVSEDVFERLVPLIQMAADGTGHASVIGKTLTWQSTDSQKQRELHIAVTSRGGQTVVRIGERYNAMAGAAFGGLMGGIGGGVGFGVGMGVGWGALGSALFATLFPIGALTASYFLARTVYRSQVGGRKRTLTELLERVAMEVEAMTIRNLKAQQRDALPPASD